MAMDGAVLIIPSKSNLSEEKVKEINEFFENYPEIVEKIANEQVRFEWGDNVDEDLITEGIKAAKDLLYDIKNFYWDKGKRYTNQLDDDVEDVDEFVVNILEKTPLKDFIARL